MRGAIVGTTLMQLTALIGVFNPPRLVAAGITLGLGLCAVVIGADPSLRWLAALAAALLAAGFAVWCEMSQQLIWAAEEARAAGGDASAVYRGWAGRGLKLAGGLMLVGLVMGLVLAGVRLRRAAGPVSPLRSEIFQTLQGCPVSAAGLRSIPARCDDARYRVRAAAGAFGLPYPNGGLCWLRIGPDAAFLRWCDEDVCKIGRVRKGVFPTRAVARE